MDIHELQQQTAEISKLIEAKYHTKRGVDVLITHLMEELGEVARHIYNQQTGRDQLDKEELGKELADCILILADIANKFDVDLAPITKQKTDELLERFK